MVAKYGCIICLLPFCKNTNTAITFELQGTGWCFASRTMFWGSRNQMAPFILMVRLSICRYDLCLFVRLSPSACFSICLAVCPSICLSIHPAVLSAYLSMLRSGFSICPFISLSGHQADLRSICPATIYRVSGLHWGLLLTVTDDCRCLGLI